MASVTIRQLVSALECAGDAVEITDQAGRLLYVNAAFEKQTGFSREEAIGSTPAQLLRSDRVPVAFFDEIWAVLSGGRPWTGEFTRRRKSGEHFPVEVSISPVQNDVGEIDHFVAISRDITERKAAEEARSRLESQLIRSQKMESLGRLAGGIAHDFNNILMGIQGFALFTLETLDEDHEAREDVQDILAGVEHAFGLTRPLLAMSQARSGTLKLLDMGDEVGRMVQLLRRTIPRGVRIEQNVAKDLPPVLANQIELEQVLVNLLVNAREALRDGGLIRVLVDSIDLLEPRDAVSGQVSAGRYVRLEVSDDGPGIETEHLGRIFEPFFTTRATGSGLGLATSWSVVKKHAGHLDVRSTVGEGTTFQVLLPARERGGVESESSSGARPAEKIRVLVVDDDERVRGVVTRMLARMGLNVRSVAGPVPALEVLRANEWVPELMLSDVIMPGMNGVELSQLAVGIRPSLRVLLMTGYSAEHLVQTDESGDEPPVISKPFGAKDLRQAVERCLARPISPPE